MPPNFLIDSHCHLDFPDFTPDFDQVIKRAQTAGVGGMLTISTKISTFDAVQRIAKNYDHIWCSVGVHPHEANAEGQAATPEHLCQLATQGEAVAFGECGLDFHYQHSTPEAQEASFRNHCQAARQAGLPVIIHTRDADSQTAAILRSECAQGRLTGVLHCFSGGRELAETAIELGFYISLSGIITFKNATTLREMITTLPLERILLETDAPYLAPVPHRGRRNEPAFVADTAQYLATLFDMSPEALASQTTANFFRLFRKARPPLEGQNESFGQG